MAYRRAATPPSTSPRRPFPTTSIREPPRGDLFHASRGKSPVKTMQPPTLGAQGKHIANQMLKEFGQMMGLDLVFGHNDTCMVNYDRTPVLITYDQPTERIYVYGNLITSLPTDLDDKLALYEFLLEASLLGKDMAGGGVGVALKNDFCLMSTSFDIRNSESHALKLVVPPFVQSFNEWKQRLNNHPVILKLSKEKRFVLEEPNPEGTAQLPADQQQETEQARNATPEPSPAATTQQAPQEKEVVPTPSPPPVPSPPPPVPAATTAPQQTAEKKMKSKALLIGIDYINTQYQLTGCCDDARTMKEFLQNNGFDEPTDILVLTDDNPDPNFHPTKQNIIKGMQWLVTDVQSDDSLFLTFSGMSRGEQDMSGTHDLVKALCPMDFGMYGTITEDEAYDIVIRNLPSKCAFNAIYDCCNAMFDMGMAWAYTPDFVEPIMVHASGGPRQAFKLERSRPDAAICVIAHFYDRQMVTERNNCHFTQAFTASLTAAPEQSYLGLARSLPQVLLSKGGIVLPKGCPTLFSTEPLQLATTYTI